MPRVYTVPFTGSSVSVAQDFWEIGPSDDMPVSIVGLVLGQYSDVGDSNSENLSVKISRGWGTSGSGGGGPTPGRIDQDGAGPSFFGDTNNTTLASAGTEVVLFSDVWNTQAGYMMWFPEGCRPSCSQATGVYLTVRVTAPADAVTVNGTLFLTEG